MRMEISNLARPGLLQQTPTGLTSVVDPALGLQRERMCTRSLPPADKGTESNPHSDALAVAA